jgi:uncharacterized membrane protein YhiD involved in acid resistance
MDPQLQEALDQLLNAVSVEQNITAVTLGLYLILGGALGLFVRSLYRNCGKSASDSEAITRIFPMLTMVTIAVISVVKSSMALSLGLVGALSIVRFRSAIKEPEELVYLFLCIGIGLALGAGQPLLAITLVLIASIFILGMHYFGRGFQSANLLLTVTGEAASYFSGEQMRAMTAIASTIPNYTLQRLDIENGRGQVRVVIAEKHRDTTVAILSKLRELLPDCDVSYVNLSNAW